MPCINVHPVYISLCLSDIELHKIKPMNEVAFLTLAIGDVNATNLKSLRCDELKVNFGDLIAISLTPSYQSCGQTPFSSFVKPMTTLYCQKSLNSFFSLEHYIQDFVTKNIFNLFQIHNFVSNKYLF